MVDRKVPILWLFAPAIIWLAFPSSGCRDLSRALGSAGSPCAVDTDCPQPLSCLTDGEGFPGGYCSQQTCDPAAGCPGVFASCVYLDRQNNVTACIETCAFDADCRLSEGYICADLDPDCALTADASCSRGCFPQALSQTSIGSIGSACATDSDCDNDLTCLSNFVFGYCSKECTSDTECGADARCSDLGGGVMRCLDACDNNRQCRFAYSCNDLGNGGVCTLDQADNPVRNPGGADDGSPCTSDIECKGGVCITGEDFPEGYCSTRDCSVVGCATQDAICAQLQRDSLCFLRCNQTQDCREGYTCAPLETGQNVCFSRPPASAPPSDDPVVNSIIDIRCDTLDLGGDVRQARFTIGSTTQGFAIVPFSPAENEVEPISMTLPNGQNFDFATQYSFQTINSLLLGVISPMLFPAAPQFENTLVMPGEYTFEFRSIDQNACYYVLEQSALGTVVDLNFYFVGVPNLNASSAPTSSDFQAVLDEFKLIYQGAGLSVGDVRYFDIAGTDRDRYQIIRDFGDIYRLIGLSTAPGTTLDDALSVNVFLIKDFNIDEIPGLLGLSAGIPGTPGVHGNGGAGLVFSSANLGAAPASLGQTMAHEVGHFLGLRHTSERGGSAFDPISDTPTCNRPEDAYNCPDIGNLMFPFSLDVTQHDVTTGQRFVLQRNPLVK